MKKRPTLILLLVGCSTLAIAQEQESKPIQTHKNDIGFNASSILPGIFGSTSTAPFTILYKRYTSDHKAIRLGISGNYNSSNIDQANGNPNYSNTSNLNTALIVGKEFQKPINNLKWTWYYGGDLMPYYNFNNNSNFLLGTPYYKSESSNVGLAFRPFLGIRYNINSQLYVSAEASLQISYGFQKTYTDYLNDNNPLSETNGHSSAVTVTPSTGVFLFYRF